MSENREDLLARAAHAEDDGDLAQAIASLEDVVRVHPNDAKTRTWLGRLYGDREQYAGAIDMLQSAIAIDDARARPHAALAEVFLELDRFAEAERAIRRSIEISPTSASFVLLGCALNAQDRPAEAEPVFREALLLDPENEEAMYNLALEVRKSHPSEALALFESAIRIDPLYSAAYREYGFQLAIALDFDRAEAALRNAIALDESDPTSRVYLANVLASIGHRSDAELELKRACELSPLFTLPHWGLAKLYEADGRYSEAEQYFRLAAGLQPSDTESAFQLGRFLLAMGRADEGEQWLDRALGQDPSHEEAARLRNRLTR